MVLCFSNKSKHIREAFNSGNISRLRREYNNATIDTIEEILDILSNANNLHDIMRFAAYRPHEVPYGTGTVLSLSIGYRKRLTIGTVDQNGQLMKQLDYSAENGIVLEVSEHYGD